MLTLTVSSSGELPTYGPDILVLSIISTSSFQNEMQPSDKKLKSISFEMTTLQTSNK